VVPGRWPRAPPARSDRGDVPAGHPGTAPARPGARELQQPRHPGALPPIGLQQLEHPLVGRVDRSVAVLRDDEGELQVVDDTEGDLCGHGTACAGVVRSLAPDAELTSVRVLGAGFKGGGEMLLRGLAWAIEEGFQVVNMSLSTTRTKYVERLHELADHAYFKRVLLVASAHNMPVRSYPWRFASVVSVASHDIDDPLAYLRNPDPPVEFYARGVEVDVAWSDGSTLRASGNSFATPHISGICALIRAKHPELTPPEVKTLLGLTATNAEAAG